MTAGYLRPRSVTEALDALSLHPDLMILAGGTDLMVGLHASGARPGGILDIWGLRELRGITPAEGGGIVVGALTTYSDLMRSPLAAAACPALVAAAAEVGAVQIQARGTVGGNVMNASPAGDTLPVLAVHEAVLDLASVRGVRSVPFLGFYKGYKQLDRAPDELLLRVRIPAVAVGATVTFRKVGTRRAQAISKVVAAVAARWDAAGAFADVRIALGSVAPTVIRLPRTEALVRGRHGDARLAADIRTCVAGEVSPIDDVRSSAHYRRTVSANIVARLLADPAA